MFRSVEAATVANEALVKLGDELILGEYLTFDTELLPTDCT